MKKTKQLVVSRQILSFMVLLIIMGIMGGNKIRISELLNDGNPSYVDIPLKKYVDEERFIDLYKIIHLFNFDEGYDYKDKIIMKVKTYFEELLSSVKEENIIKINELKEHSHEDKLIKLGYGSKGPGKGFGTDTFDSLVSAIKTSHAAQSGMISDILDAELYTENVGLDTISDLVGNLIHDVLSDYTVKKLEQLGMSDKLYPYEMTYWNENTRSWNARELHAIKYTYENGDLSYFLLTPLKYTGDSKQKEVILKSIFDVCVYNFYESKIYGNPSTYEQYIHRGKNRDTVYKKSVVDLMKMELGSDTARNCTITCKGLMELVLKYPVIKKYIEERVKQSGM